MGFVNGWLVRAVLRGTDGANEAVNTLHYDLRGGVTDRTGSIQDLADRLAVDLLGPYRACYPPGWTIDPIIVTEEIDPQNPTAVREQRTAGVAAAGTWNLGTTDTLPLAICAVAKLRTEQVGRSFRGRMFMPPCWRESDQNGAMFEVGNGTNYVSKLTAFLDAIPKEPDIVWGESESPHWTIYSRTRRAAGLEGYANDVVSYELPRVVHWLRSRDQNAR